MLPIKFQPVMIIWEDACSLDAWSDVSSMPHEPRTIVNSLGYFIGVSDERIILSLNHDTTNDAVSCTIFIPINMVEEARKLTSEGWSSFDVNSLLHMEQKS